MKVRYGDTEHDDFIDKSPQRVILSGTSEPDPD